LARATAWRDSAGLDGAGRCPTSRKQGGAGAPDAGGGQAVWRHGAFPGEALVGHEGASEPQLPEAQRQAPAPAVRRVGMAGVDGGPAEVVFADAAARLSCARFAGPDLPPAAQTRSLSGGPASDTPPDGTRAGGGLPWLVASPPHPTSAHASPAARTLGLTLSNPSQDDKDGARRRSGLVLGDAHKHVGHPAPSTTELERGRPTTRLPLSLCT